MPYPHTVAMIICVCGWLMTAVGVSRLVGLSRDSSMSDGAPYRGAQISAKVRDFAERTGRLAEYERGTWLTIWGIVIFITFGLLQAALRSASGGE